MEYYSAIQKEKTPQTQPIYNMEQSQYKHAEWKKLDRKKKEYKSFI